MKTLFFLIGILFGANAFGQIPTSGLVAEYLFTGASLNDTGGTNHLTLTGTLAATAPDRAGGANRAISLNGDHLQRATGTSTNSFSISFWIKTSTNDATARVVIDRSERTNEGEGSTQVGWYVYLKNGTINMACNFEWYRWNTSGYLGWQYATTSANIADGLWHHVTITNRSYMESRLVGGEVVGMSSIVYVDNILKVTKVSEKALGAVTGSTIRRFAGQSLPITIGNTGLGNSSTNFRFADAIDDIRYYSRTLSAAEVTTFATEAGNATAATVTKLNQTITFAALPSKTMGAANFTLTATSSSGLAVTYASSNPSVATVSGNTVTVIGVGSTVITASQGGNMVFNPATDVVNTLTVNQGTQTINFVAPTTRAYGSASFALSATATSGLPLSFTSSDPNVATISGNSVTITGAGSTTITASQAGNANYSAATSIQHVFTVTKANQTIAFAALANKTFGDANFNLTATSSSGLPVSYTSQTGIATISGNTVTIVSVGITYIYASQAGNANYNAATVVDQRFEVTKANQTITIGTLPIMSFGDPTATLMGTSSSALPVSYTSSNTSVATVSGNTLTIVGVGSTTITASQVGNVNFNVATAVARTLTVVKANQSITFGALASKTFGDATFTLAATTSSNLPVSYSSSNSAVASISGNTVTIIGAGTSTITASQAGDANFNAATQQQQTLTVNKANQTISFAALPTKLITDAPFALTASASSNLPVSFSSSNASVATVSGNTLTIVAVGTSTIAATQSGNANYHAAVAVSHTLTVNAKDNQTITFAPLVDKTLGDSPFLLTASSSSNLSVSYTTVSDKLQINGNQVSIVKAGRASITAAQAGDALFNAAASVTQSFCIKPAKPVVTASNINTPSPTLTSSSSSGNQWFKNGTAIVDAVGSTLTLTEAGIYTVRVQVDDCISSFSNEQSLVVTAIEPSLSDLVSVYPNPVVEELTIDLSMFEKQLPVSIGAVDIMGRVMHQQTGVGGSEVKVNVRSYAPGQYLLQIKQGNIGIAKSFIKN
ncbi:MAG: T9SS type A sorting domain-containing protein [Cyclobacteriaceae bacterium]|nr:T9SS type A sorting domain-containing protein [Cyclobacteriaceae bacterium]